MANNAEAWRAGQHPGYEETAWEGLQQTIEAIAHQGIRVAINGGALDPKALAERVATLVAAKNLDLSVAYLTGDDLYARLGPSMPATKDDLQHLDAGTPSVAPSELSYAFLRARGEHPVPMVSAHAYLGARGIVDGFRRGADIVVCGRVADASPVIAAAWFWHGWAETDYDELAGALVAGHLIECSAYVTGGNFAGFDACALEDLVQPGFPVAEIARDGTCVVTKHAGTQGMVTTDTVRCQFLYELQGSVYLNSDVRAHLGAIAVEDEGKDRVRVSGIRGSPPPPTTKLAVFYPGGYEAELLLNATGYGTARKWDLIERQIRHFLPDAVAHDLETLEFQRIGVPAANPASQAQSTTYLRVFAASRSARSVAGVALALKDISLKHFAGFHCSLDTRTAIPRPFLAYYPALIQQSDLDEQIHLLDSNTSYPTGHPPRYEPLAPRETYDPDPASLPSTDATKAIRLGDIALARSGDKGANLNIGLFVPDDRHWPWLRAYLTRARLRALIGDQDWDDSFAIERVEFPRIRAVHFVVYGILGRGVSSSSRLDGFGKGFADYVRDKVVDVPAGLVS